MGIITRNNINGCDFGSQMSQYACLFGIGNKTNLEPCFLPNQNVLISEPFVDKPKLINYDISNLKSIETDWKFNKNMFLLDSKYNYNITSDLSNFKYFHDIRDEILKIYTFNENIKNICTNIIKSIKQQDEILVSVHFRRGDYLYMSSLNLSLNYYNEAIKIIETMFFNKKIKYLIFSNDIEWVENNFKPNNCVYIKNLNRYEDMCLMSMCDHNIIANSSFSWWGAYLNKNTNKKVICPYYYSKTSVLIDGNYFPKDWISLTIC